MESAHGGRPPARHAAMSSPRASRRRLLTAGAWAAPVIMVGAQAPALAGSVSADTTFTSTPSSGGNTKTYSFSVKVDPGAQTITTLRMRFTIDATYSNATYDTSANGQPAPPTGWSRVALSATEIIFQYNGTLSGPTTLSATFSLVRQNNPDSRVLVDTLVTTSTQGETLQDRSIVTFAGGTVTIT